MTLGVGLIAPAPIDASIESVVRTAPAPHARINLVLPSAFATFRLREKDSAEKECGISIKEWRRPIIFRREK